MPTIWCTGKKRDGELSFTPVTSILFSLSEPFPCSRCRDTEQPTHRAPSKPNTKDPNLDSLIFFTCRQTQTCEDHKLLPFRGTGKRFMLKMPPDMSNLRGWGWEGKQTRRECCSGVLIVCSLSVFYVTTTHCFSSTYGWVPGMCFLSLFLMTWVTSLTLHMLAKDGPASLGALERWTLFSVLLDDNLEFPKSYVVWSMPVNYYFPFGDIKGSNLEDIINDARQHTTRW